MADIFQEVDEEVRREQLKKLWDRYGLHLIAVAVLAVLAVAGWRGYQWYEVRKAAEASSAFEAAIALGEGGKHKEAEQAFAKIAAEAPSGYRMLARFRVAAELAQTDVKAAVAAYDAIAGDASLGLVMQDLAAVRAGMLLADSAPLADLQRRLDPTSEPERAFRHTAREMLAFSAWRNGDVTAARRYVDMISADAETPAGTRQRIDALSSLLAAGSAKG